MIFTTIQKFAPEQGEQYPQLSDRRNIVFIADEAHRSQYGLSARLINPKNTDEAYISYGFAKYLRDALPHASFIGFTGTPIELGYKSTKNVFGDYIDIYDLQRAVEDEATVRIYYEARIAQLNLDESKRPHIDPNLKNLPKTKSRRPKTN